MPLKSSNKPNLIIVLAWREKGRIEVFEVSSYQITTGSPNGELKKGK